MTAQEGQGRTRFGYMTTIHRHGHTVEILLFAKEGKNHTHEEWEHAVCLSGPCVLIYNDGTPHEVTIGRIYTVPPNMPHRMRPLTSEPSVWLLWYSHEAISGPEPVAWRKRKPHSLLSDGTMGYWSLHLTEPECLDGDEVEALLPVGLT